MSIRTTISLPDDLKARMDAVTDVNWSGEAAKCFERVLGEIAKRKPNKDLADAVARLRASRLESEEAGYRVARDYGRLWAVNHATYYELRRAAEYDTDQIGQGQVLAPWRWCDLVACHVQGINPDEEVHPDDDAESFWEQVSFSSAEVEAMGEVFLKGFLDGAGEIWQAVADQL